MLGLNPGPFCLSARRSFVQYAGGGFLVSVWVPSGSSGLLPRSKDMQVRLIGDSKSPVGVNVSVNGCLSLYVSPVMNWRLVQDVPCPCPMSAGIGSSPHSDPAG